MHEAVVGPIDLEQFLEPVVEGVGARPGFARHAQQVAPVPRPLLGEFVGGEQAVDQAIAFVGRAIRDEGAHVRGGRRQAGDVEVDAAHELVVAGERRVRHFGRSEAVEDQRVDEVAAWHGPRGRRGIHRTGHRCREARRVACLVIAAQAFVRRFHAVVRGGRRRRTRLRPDGHRVERRGGHEERRGTAQPGHGRHQEPPGTSGPRAGMAHSLAVRTPCRTAIPAARRGCRTARRGPVVGSASRVGHSHLPATCACTSL